MAVVNYIQVLKGESNFRIGEEMKNGGGGGGGARSYH